MIRRLWIRFWLYAHDICPKHGPMDGGMRPYLYCATCATEKNEAHERRCKRYQHEYLNPKPKLCQECYGRQIVHNSFASRLESCNWCKGTGWQRNA